MSVYRKRKKIINEFRRIRLVEDVKKKILEPIFKQKPFEARITGIRRRKRPTLIKTLYKFRPSLKGLNTYRDTKSSMGLGPTRVMSIELSDIGIEIVKGYPITRYPIEVALLGLYRLIRSEAIRLINRMAPKDTGELRDSLIESFYDQNNRLPQWISSPKEIKFDIQMYSKRDYAEYVNEMPQDNLRHYGGKISWRTGRPLYDPYAENRFFGKIRRKLKRQIKNTFLPNFYNAVDTHIGDINLTKDMFKVKMR